MLYDTTINNREKWINEIKKYTGEKDTANVIQYALSYTLQALRHNDENRYKWEAKDEKKVQYKQDFKNNKR